MCDAFPLCFDFVARSIMSIDRSPLLPVPNRLSSEVLDLVRERATDPKIKIVHATDGPAFGPIYGITVVSMLTESCIETFAVPLYNALSNIAEIRDSLLLLPPESYHMTLRGLEETLPSVTIGALEALDGDYAAMFAGMEHAITVEPVFEDRGFSAAVLPVALNPASVQVYDAALAASSERLGIVPHVQEYHVSAGYYLTTSPSERQRVQAIVLAEAQKVFASRALSVTCPAALQLLPPRVCWYDSMKRFPHLFPSPVE